MASVHEVYDNLGVVHTSENCPICKTIEEEVVSV